MATRIRTLDFLPEIFKTPTNAQFLSATLDQLVAQPNTEKIQGYVGSRFGYGVNPNDNYVAEPTKTRTDYQLEPGVVFLKPDTATANDFISYPAYMDALKLKGGLTADNSRLFTSQFYSWDPFTDLDKIINFNQYYWLPVGPERVIVSNNLVYNFVNYTVTSDPAAYVISSDISSTGAINPTLTLLRGGTYTFTVDQTSEFWIQGEPGITGYSRTQPNVQTRNVYGVVNNGAEQGVVTFTVPYKNALDQYVLPGDNTVDVVSTLTFEQVNGAPVLSIGGIDGVTSLDGLTMMFYGSGNRATYYTISLIGEGANPTIQLTTGALIPSGQNIRVNFGTEWIGRNFFRNIAGVTELIPYNSAILDTLYYQDGTTSSKVGVIRLIDSNFTSDINVVTQILGKKTYTSPNGVVFTNGLKVLFQGNIYPESYNNVEYYVEGVGTSIELIPISSLVSPGLFSSTDYTPFDTTPYDIGNYDSNLYVPIDTDYITIARNAINKNAWSRSNRWFHIDVINATAAYNDSPELIAEYTTYYNKAKRPIIEFYPNLELFNSGTLGKSPIDFIDTKTTNAFLEVEGTYSYYPDTAGYTSSTATIAPVTGSISKLATSTSAQVNQVLLNNVTGINVNDTVTFGVYTAGSLVIGETYTIVSLGNTDFTLIGAAINDVGVTFVATGAGTGTGTASGASFGNIVSGVTYYITAINLLNNGITIATTRQGATVTLLDGSGSIAASIYPYSTTITIPTSDVFGLFQVNQYITDNDSILPQPTQISSITTQSTNTIITVFWYSQSIVPAATNVSVVTGDTPLDNYSIFDGARVVFAMDENVNVRDKIYVAQFSTISEGSTPIITLSEASDGLVLPQEQTVVYRGYNYLGKDFYYDGVDWIQAQQKITTNQAPKFDVFDKNGVSLSDKEVYGGSSFAGCTLFQYGIGTGSDDSVLGFPLRYSAVANLGDISFDVTLNSQTFNYVDGTNPKTENVNIGFVYNYTLPEVTFGSVEPLSFDRLGRVRQTGWETAVSPSIQYQIFEFPWSYLDPVTSLTCDIAPNSSSSTNWPTVQVYVDNTCLPSSAYSIVTTDTSTTVTIPDLAVTTDTEFVIQILIYSDQVSPTAYYQIPINLSNNPFNASLTTANIGEIRGQYQSIFYNNPYTIGQIFGSNNYRDLGNLVPWGSTIIQNSASLVLPGTFLRQQEHNLFDALIYNSRQYITFKNLLINTVSNTSFTAMQTPSEMLDDVMVQLTTGKTDTESFFWSDMLPAKAPYISNTYTFPNSLDVSTYGLSRIYDFSVSNYYGVLVYLTRNNIVTQLISKVDYTISSTSPSLTITTDLLPNDKITINEYYQTYGNYVPNTPTKLGLYPSTIPAVVLDPDYTIPTYFIVGHDGSFNKLYGDYNTVTGKLVDFRDQVLLEYEKRVYNNLKLSNTIPVELYEILPGFFRTTDYSYDEFLQIYSESFLNWVGENRIDYQRQIFNTNNQFTFNYRDSGNKINREAIEQGYFRGLYLYYYDTSTPDTTPWQMIGYSDQPTWWTSRYGAAPYTSNNLVLWGDLAEGIDWNDGNPIVIPKYVRNGLLDVIPVDSSGNLVSPLISIVGNYDQFLFNRDWIVGDVGPAEFSYRRSSSWPFDLMRILALTKPADFFNLGVNVDIYKYNIEFDQYLVNDRSHLVPSDIQVYGSGTPVTSYINWIIDYEKQVGIDATTNITTLLNNLDVRLVYRMAGFSDKTFLSFYIEKSSANANNSALLIPNESYGLLLYQNQPFDRIVYSGVVVQITKDGYKVFGNSQTNAYFKVLVPKATVVMETITVQNKSVRISNDFYTETKVIPYGTEFYNLQQVAEFLNSYGAYLVSQGMLFETIENGIQVTWKQMISEFLYWSQMGWGIGSITTINPAASTLAINKDSYIVQPLTLQQFNFILNQNLYPIQNVDMSIIRDETAFTASPLNSGDAISYGQFNISNMEHAIVFDNTTLFNDTIYNLVTGLRQNRIYLRGTKTAEWNGTLSPSGFILNQDNILDWNNELKYTKGTIVKYKNKYWTALQIVQASQIFDQLDWKEVPYDEIQKGLLLNSQTRSYESTLYYDVNRQALQNDADVLSFSLIGYRPRDYLAVADLTEITQVNVYKNMIKEKGTLKALTAFKGATLPQGGIDYDIYENWAILAGEFNGVLNNNFIQFRLKQSDLTSNPFIVSLTDGVGTVGSQQEVPTYSVFNYGRPITSANILPTISPTTPSSLYPTAGYVNFNDVKMSSYYYSGLATAQNAAGTVIPIDEFYVRDYVWLASYLGTWNVYTPTSLGTVVYAKNNINGTVTITFNTAHNLKRFDLFAIVNFDPAINNYYIVSVVVDPFSLIINLSLDSQITNITGEGIAFQMQTQRVPTAPKIENLSSLLANEFNKLKVWVDTNNDGSWAVYRKSLNYQYNTEITKLATGSFGTAVAHTNNLGYLISDPDNSIVYRYRYNGIDNTYNTDQTLNQGPSFGSFISYADDFFVISEPTAGLKVYVYQLIFTILEDEIVLYQTIASPDVAITEWGASTAISGDKNWLYISATLEFTNKSVVYVYRFNTQTELYDFETILDISAVASDNFGYSIATDYYGDTVAIGAPGTNYDIDTANYGYTYIFSRTVQSFVAASTSQSYIPLIFPLSWTPDTITQIATNTTAGTNRITVASTTGFTAGDTIVFTGTILSSGALSNNVVYYILSGFTSTQFQVSLTFGGSPIALITDSGSMSAVVQNTKLNVTINGLLLADNNYAVIGSELYVYSGTIPTLNAGDLLDVSSGNFVLAQTLDNGETPRVGTEFGYSIETNNFANEILVGAPFELDEQNHEGAVHRFTNGGEKYGMIIGTQDCNITSPRTILLNGFVVNLPVGNATTAASTINASSIINVQASTSNGKLLIALVDTTISIPNKKLSLTVLNTDTLDMMGVTLYTETQKIMCPHLTGATQFGSTIKLDNVTGSIVVSAPVGTRFVATTFDFTDDEFDNDTVFDNNATQWVDTFTNAGAVYMFDYLSAYNETLSEPGKYVYAQSTNANNIDYGSQPLYGKALDFNNNNVVIGSPNFNPLSNFNVAVGQVVIYISSSATPDWTVYRSSSDIVDINGVFNTQLFSASTNLTLDNLDYLDPLQGKLLGAVTENIDVVSNIDPACYNSSTDTQRGLVWGTEKLGQLWFNTSTTRFLNYHQNDVVYNSQYWGRVFPGSDVAVYSWITSNVTPSAYTGPGTPFSFEDYVTHGVINAEGLVVPIYYFWVRNTNIVFEQLGKTLSDSTLEFYITNPQASGISYFAPLLTNTFAVYNGSDYLNGIDTVINIGYATSTNDNVLNTEYNLIRANFADDFLPGIPGSGAAFQYHSALGIAEPIGLYNRMLDSMCGVDNAGAVIPDPFLPLAVRTGVLARPRQGFFINRFGALENYLQYANIIVAQFPILELRNPTFLFNSGESFDTTQYWTAINWWATGYNDNTKSSLQVPLYADLATLNVATGTIVTVAANGAGLSETYIYTVAGTWVRIGLQNGTVKFSSYLWDYASARLGFGDNFFDTDLYDLYPSEETRNIVRALNEQIYTDELLIFRNKSLILLFEYIQSETIESQNYLVWLNKTSLVDASHTIRELIPFEVFRSDNQVFLEGYINEAKPYHVVIKDFLFKYTRTDIFEGDITDFDLPAKYNTNVDQFISPALVYSNPALDNEYLYTDPIWQDPTYSQWYENYGLSLVGEKEFPIAILESYLALNTTSCYVNNASGFPVTGTILIGTELIGYSGVDVANNQLYGLSRGSDNTTPEIHLPGESVLIDLPGVLLLYGARAYTLPPIITAYIDTSIYPAPRVAAKLQPIMSLDKMIGVTVLDPGEGYAVLPEIIIEPAFTLDVSSLQVDIENSQIQLIEPVLATGDLIQYNVPSGSTEIHGLINGQRYYVNVIESDPVVLFALYPSYSDAINEHNRIIFGDVGTGTQQFSLGGYATCISASAPIRENIVTLRFDRTSYTSDITDWESGYFYGSRILPDITTISSSSITLESSQPAIDTVLASGGGIPFDILDVNNQQTLEWSSRTRETIQTYGSISAYPNTIRINPSTGGANVNQDIGSTIGFYIGMPVKFQGSVVGGLVFAQTYYVKSLVQLPNLTTSVLEDTGFTISDTIDDNGVPGATYALTTATVPLAGLTLFTGETINLAELTINYDDLRTATSTTAGSNIITVDLTPIGQAGTTKLYTGLPVFFTVTTPETVVATAIVIGQSYIIASLGTTDFRLIGASKNVLGVVFTATAVGTGTGTASLTTFGGITANEIYYVTSIIDNYALTVSTVSDPTTFSVTATTASIVVNAGFFVIGNTYIITTLGNTDFTDFGASVNQVGVSFVATNVGAGTGTGTQAATITCETTTLLSVNDPIMFTGEVFGGIVLGQLYYVSVIYSGGLTFAISQSIGGASVALTTASGSCTLTSQADSVQLTTTTGSMTFNVGLSPISPGQINGQLLTFYPTSPIDIIGVYGPISNLIERVISSTLASVDRICLSSNSGGITNVYTGMEFNIGANIGGLTTAGGPYTITGTGTTTVIVEGTESVGNWLVLPVSSNPDTTDVLYEGMPIVFTGAAFGGISVNTLYYVLAIDTSPPVGEGRFTITKNFIDEVSMTTFTGSVTGTGETYIEVAETLTSQLGPVTFTQYHDPAVFATFDVGYLLGGYIVNISNPGNSYAVTNKIVIPGTDLGGITTLNDMTLTVDTVDATGGITSVIASGITPGLNEKYYVKVLTSTTVGLYQDPQLQIPVSGLNFPYVPITTTTATSTSSSNNRITVSSSTSFAANDPVIFTGDIYGAGEFGNIVLGETYYILTKPTTTSVTISETIGGSTFVLANGSGTMTMAKIGDYALLPEPFFFTPSIVKFNNTLYQCVISNNDPDFEFGKWVPLFSRDRQLNALDRILGYYAPTVNMPGVDLTQLVSGITYPKSTYQGNAFEPADEYTLDAILTNKAFYPTNIDLKAIIWDGTKYVASIETTDYSAIATSTNAVDWLITRIANSPVQVTDLHYNNGLYLLATDNNATPILRSSNGLTWTNSENLYSPMNSLEYGNGIYVGAGNTIVSSTDGITWTERYAFTNGYTNVFNYVTYVSAGFIGFMAVGLGQRLVGSNLVNVPLIYTSTNGTTWTQVAFTDTTLGFNAVAGNNDTIAVVGEDGALWTTFNSLTWFEQNSTVADTFNDIIWNDTTNIFVAVGDNGTIVTGTSDGITWTERTSTTTENLRHLVWNSVSSLYVVVGDNNAVLTSPDGIVWTLSSFFESSSAPYTIEGDTFAYGYGPEELVPGVVLDTMTMVVTTRPGTNWEETVYQHVGYNANSLELQPTNNSQTDYSFLDAVQIPAQLTVSVIDYNTGVSTTIYDGIDYTVDWVNSIVTLNTPLYFVTAGVSDTLRIDVYEVGNGYQLIKSNSLNDPLRINAVTGFQEIFVNANYTGYLTQGSGLIRPLAATTIATETFAADDTVLCVNANDFILNGAVKFFGTTFGNIVEGQTYFVKSIIIGSDKITLSETLPNGIAGPIFALSNATGSMEASIQAGTGATWATPAMFYNGNSLVLGTTATVTQTISATNTVATNSDSTGVMVVGSTVVFSDSMFGGVIVPHQTYYIESILNSSEFTISTTLGGPVLSLTNANGSADIVTNDYAFGIADNGVTGKIIYAAEYDTTVDYLAYSLLGETTPQYGYTIPQTQLFTGNGSTTFNLINYIDSVTATNAIVEIDGLRLLNTDYTISVNANTITFVSAPANGSTIAVITYNTTDRQYFNTQFGITGIEIYNISNVDNNVTPSIATIAVSGTTSGTNYVTCTSTANLIASQPITFKAANTVSGDFVIGYQYRITTVGNTNFVALGASSNTVGVIFTATGTGTLGETGTAFLTNLGNISLLGTIYYIRSIVNLTQFTIEDQTGNIIVLSTATNNIVGIMGGLDSVSVTTSISNNFVLNDIVRINGVNGTIQLNNNTYYVRIASSTLLLLYYQPYNPIFGAINYPVTNVDTYTSGGVVTLNNAIQVVSAYQQVNVDRLWVTVNGYRVPSSSLTLNANNYLSILVPISPADEITITSMMPTATPNQLTYLLNVTLQGEPSVYRANDYTRTWLVEPLSTSDSVIYLNDTTHVTDYRIQESVTPAPVDGVYTVGLYANKNDIVKVIVYNNSSGITVNPNNYNLTIIGTGPSLEIYSQVSTGDNLTITVIQGGLVIINGEQIRFADCDIATHTLSSITRGVNGTSEREFIPKYTEVYGIISTNRMSDTDYAKTWNPIPGIYNSVLGDPLQIADTQAAIFLRTNIN